MRGPAAPRIARAVAVAAALAWQPAWTTVRTGLADLEGRYSRTRSLPMLDGSGAAYEAEDVLEIARESPGQARLKLETHFPNGHSCTFEGTGRLIGGVLRLREARRGSDGRLCRLAVRRQGEWIVWTDGGGRCASYCGIRGTLNGRLPYGSRARLR